MAIAVNPKENREYVLEEDRGRPQEEQTVFILKNLTASELAKLEDSLTDYSLKSSATGKELSPEDIKMSLNIGSQTLRVLRMGLVGWKNFKGEDGKDVSFMKQGETPREQNWDRLRPEWRREIANVITEQTKLTPDEVKN